MRFVRDCLTGELKQVQDDPRAEFDAIRSAHVDKYRHFVTRRRRLADPYDRGKDHVDIGMSLKPEDATPARIEAENEACRRHGTGAYYTPDGLCHTPTRGSRAREMARPHHGGYHYQDNNAGYSDCAGR